MSKIQQLILLEMEMISVNNGAVVVYYLSFLSTCVHHRILLECVLLNLKYFRLFWFCFCRCKNSVVFDTDVDIFCSKWTSHRILNLRLRLRWDIALKNSFSQNNSMIVYIFIVMPLHCLSVFHFSHKLLFPLEAHVYLWPNLGCLDQILVYDSSTLHPRWQPLFKIWDYLNKKKNIKI